MGVEDFGKYGVLTAYFGVFYVLAVMGAPRYVVREMARARTIAGDYDIGRQQRWFHITLLNQLIGGILAVIVMLCVAHLLNHPSDTRQALLLSSLSLIPAAISSAMEIALQAVEKMDHIAVTHIVAGGIQLIGSLTALWLGHGLWMLAWMMVIWQVTIALMQIVITLRLGFWNRFHWYGRESLILFRDSFEFFILSLSAIVFSRLDVLILSQVAGEAAVGVYNAAYLVVRGINFIAASYGQAIYPTLSHCYRQSRAQFEKLIFKSLLWGMVGMLLVALALSIYAEQIIQLLYAQDAYSLAARVLAIEAIFVAIFFWNSVLSRGLMAGDMQSRSVVVSTIKLVIALGYYSIFTNWWGVTGAAIATVTAALTGTALNYYFVNKYVYRLDIVTLLIKPLMVAVVSGGIWFLLLNLGCPFAVVVGLGVYIGLAWSLHLVSDEDIMLLKRVTIKSRRII